MLAKWTVDETHTPATGTSPEKFRYVVKIPAVLTDLNTGAVKSPRFTQLEIQAFLPLDATVGEVNDIAAIAESLTASAYFQDALRNSESAW